MLYSVHDTGLCRCLLLSLFEKVTMKKALEVCNETSTPIVIRTS